MTTQNFLWMLFQTRIWTEVCISSVPSLSALGVVSKALGWVTRPDVVVPDDRLRKPFATKRHKSDKVFIVKPPRFRLDPKHAISAHPVDSVALEFALIEDTRTKRLDTGVSTEEDFTFPPTVIHLRQDDGCQADLEPIAKLADHSVSPDPSTEAPVLGSAALDANRCSVDKSAHTENHEPDAVKSKLFNPLMLPEPGPNMFDQGGSFKFKLPPMKRKRDPKQRKEVRREQLRSRKISFSALAAAILIQKSWRRYTQERKKGLFRLVHTLFDDYFTEVKAESSVIPRNLISIPSPMRFIYNSRS